MSLHDIDRLGKLRRVPPGRARQAASNIEAIATRLDQPALLPFTERTKDAAMRYVEIRGRRASQRDARGDGRAAERRKPVVTRLAMIYETGRRFSVDMPDSPEGRAGAQLLRVYFPLGLGAVVNTAYEEGALLGDCIAQGLSGPHAELAEALFIQHHVAALQVALPALHEALDVTDRVSAEDVADAYEALQVCYAEMAWAVMVLVREPRDRAALLAPVFDQDDRLAAVYAARRRGQAVAEVIDLDAEAETIVAEDLADAEAERAAEREGAAEATEEDVDVDFDGPEGDPGGGDGGSGAPGGGASGGGGGRGPIDPPRRPGGDGPPAG